MRIFITLLFFVLASKMLHTQQNTVVIHYDPNIESSINAYIASAQEEKLKGFRMQLCSESDNNAKDIANTIKSRFLQHYQNVPAYLIWESPNFKIHISDFKTRLNATLF